MTEQFQDRQELADKTRQATKAREEYQRVRMEYDRYRLLRSLMGKTKRNTMDFEEFRRNVLSLTTGGFD